MTLKTGMNVETLIADPHPAAFAGVVVAVSEKGLVLVRAANGVERAYTSDSLRAS